MARGKDPARPEAPQRKARRAPAPDPREVPQREREALPLEKMVRLSRPPDLGEAPARDAAELGAAAEVEKAHFSPDEELAESQSAPPAAPGEEENGAPPR